MYRRAIAVLLLGFALTGPAIAATKSTPKKSTATKKKKTAKKPTMAVTCPTSLATITDCPDTGCGPDLDKNLNRLKNMLPDDPKAQQSAESRTLQSIKDLNDPEDFVKGGKRTELTDQGEGTKVSVVAYLLVAKREGGESCNCKLTDDGEDNKDIGVNTDNHLVLVSRATLDEFPIDGPGDVFHKREAESITAEFTPRVRLTHPNFVRAKVQPLIDGAPEEALRVRVTGMLMFDSEHFMHNALNRVNNWEIHPILKLEYCDDDTCEAGSDAGWKSLDDCPSSGCT